MYIILYTCIMYMIRVSNGKHTLYNEYSIIVFLFGGCSSSFLACCLFSTDVKELIYIIILVVHVAIHLHSLLKHSLSLASSQYAVTNFLPSPFVSLPPSLFPSPLSPPPFVPLPPSLSPSLFVPLPPLPSPPLSPPSLRRP